MPLYEKSHSWGEFVFDWAWAHAYERAGLDYYPKPVSAAPFTPAQSRRLLLRDADDAEAAAAQVAFELLFNPEPHARPHPPCKNHEVVRVPHDDDIAGRFPLSPLVSPKVQGVVQIDVGQ